jgi:hypothetical protein
MIYDEFQPEVNRLCVAVYAGPPEQAAALARCLRQNAGSRAEYSHRRTQNSSATEDGWTSLP